MQEPRRKRSSPIPLPLLLWLQPSARVSPFKRRTALGAEDALHAVQRGPRAAPGRGGAGRGWERRSCRAAVREDPVPAAGQPSGAWRPSSWRDRDGPAPLKTPGGTQRSTGPGQCPPGLSLSSAATYEALLKKAAGARKFHAQGKRTATGRCYPNLRTSLPSLLRPGRPTWASTLCPGPCAQSPLPPSRPGPSHHRFRKTDLPARGPCPTPLSPRR